jgi:hypothetical protein
MKYQWRNGGNEISVIVEMMAQKHISAKIIMKEIIMAYEI